MNIDFHRSVQLERAQTLGKHVAILGMTGSGKTNTGYVWAEEELAEGGLLTILDPEGDYHLLQGSFDILILGCARKGNPLDLQVTADQAPQLADVLTRRAVSVILDLSGYNLRDKNAFVLAYIGHLWALYQLEDLPPMRLIIDEAQLFAPQGPMTEAKELIQDVAARGRKRGLALLVASQRPQNVDKSVLDATDIRFLHKVPRGRTLAAYNDLLPGSLPDAKNIVPALERGEAIFMVADDAQIIQVRQSTTFRPGADLPQHTIQSAIDADLLDELKRLLAQPIESTAGPATSGGEHSVLQAELTRLRSEVATLRAQPVQVVEVPVLPGEQIAHLAILAGQVIDHGQDLIRFGQSLLNAIGAADQAGSDPEATTTKPEVCESEPADSGQIHLRAGERRILQTIAQRHPVRLTRSQIGTLAGFTPSGGTFTTYLGTLKRHGLITEVNGETSMTQAGFNFLGADVPPVPKTTADLLSMWYAALRTGERRMLEALVQVYPKAMTRYQLGEKSGYTASGGTFGTYLGTLKRNGLADVNGEMVTASSTLFLDSQREAL